MKKLQEAFEFLAAFLCLANNFYTTLGCSASEIGGAACLCDLLAALIFTVPCYPGGFTSYSKTCIIILQIWEKSLFALVQKSIVGRVALFTLWLSVVAFKKPKAKKSGSRRLRS